MDLRKRLGLIALTTLLTVLTEYTRHFLASSPSVEASAAYREEVLLGADEHHSA